MLLLLRALVADELACLVAADPGDVRDQVDLFGCQREQEQSGMSSALQDLECPALEPLGSRSCVAASSMKGVAKRRCSHAEPEARRAVSARDLARQSGSRARRAAR